MEFVYSIEAKNAGALKKVLEENAFADDSFARNGYVWKESQAVGLPNGSFVLYFKTQDEKLAGTLNARVKAVEGIKELTEADKEKVVSVIKAEEDSAAAGFGNIFG